MLPILSYWPSVSEVDIVGMAVEAEPSHQYPVVCCCVTDGSRGHCGTTVPDMEMHVKQRCVIEFLHAEQMALTDTHQHLLECLWRSNGGCEHSEVMDAAFQQR